MNPIADIHDQALRVTERDLGCPVFTWLGTQYLWTPSTVEIGQAVDWGGRLQIVKLSGKVRVSAICGAAKPLVSGKVISYQGEEYRIVTAALSSARDHIKLTLIDPNV
jgi:hypothetical protein